MAKHGSHFIFGVSSSKGASEEEGERKENKNKFEKLKTKQKNSQVEGEEVCFQVQAKEFSWGVCKYNMSHTENNYTSTSRNFKTISVFIFFWGAEGGISSKV